MLNNNLPVHFFTIVLNGVPFIKYHIKMLLQLPFKWHWHIVEGAAEQINDTDWSKYFGGKVPDRFLANPLSNDGTTEYINSLIKLYPHNITAYRKSNGELWKGKTEMVNAPVDNIKGDCLLWQIDVDEFWRVDNVEKLRQMFIKNPKKNCAYLYCYLFAGENKYAVTPDSWNTEANDWIRVFRIAPDHKAMWVYHEPPVLNFERQPFQRNQTLMEGITFQHFAYATEKQVQFKAEYYGEKLININLWRELQKTVGMVKTIDYFIQAKNMGYETAVINDWDDREPNLFLQLMKELNNEL